MRSFVYILSGVLFSSGLLISGMANPEKVKAFLNLNNSHWSPALLFVLSSATLTYFLCYMSLRRKGKTFSGTVFHSPKARGIDTKLIAGSVIFGMGWGLSGLCPGPAIVQLAFFELGTLAFLISMFLGFELQRRSA